MFAATAAAANITTLAVIDPCNRTGKITVPMAFVSETRGVQDFIDCGGNPLPEVKDLSLCLLYQKGRCNAGTRCKQVHATPAFIEQVRSRSRAGRTCCARHGDVHSSALDESRSVLVMAADDSAPIKYSLADFALTPALEQALSRARGTVRVLAARICRLHQRGSCKFGRDCRNVHLCSDAHPPALGIALRGLDVSGSFAAATAVASVESSVVEASVRPLSVLSIFDEMHSMRREADSDPLDIDDVDSSCSGVSATDFDAFVDALVHMDPATIESPQWPNHA